MRKTNFLILLALILSGFMPLVSSGQEVQTKTDDFSVAHNYLTDGVVGTIWDGLMLNNGNIADGPEAQITKLNTSDSAGTLTFATINSNWSGAMDNGAFLYKNTKPNTDFEVVVKIAGGDYESLGGTAVPYLMSGPMVRWNTNQADSNAFIAVQVFDQYSTGFGLRNIPMDPEENWTSDATQTPALYPFVKLVREGNTFKASYSSDGETWVEYKSFDRPDLADKVLQVGLYNATYTEVEGKVVFDDFSFTGTPVDVVAPTAPANLSAITDSTSALLSWDASWDNVMVAGYDVYLDNQMVSSTVNTHFLLSDLEKEKIYEVSVKAYDTVGNISEASTIKIYTIVDEVAPSAPANLVVSSANTTSISLTWDPSTDEGLVASYDVYVSFESVSATVIGTVTEPEFVAEGLQLHKEYSFFVTAKDLAGNVSEASATVIGSCIDTDLPSKPDGLVAVEISKNSIVLAWNPSTDNDEVVGYDVFVDGVYYESVANDTVSTITGLTPNTAYSLTVQAFDATLNGSEISDALAVTTDVDGVNQSAVVSFEAYPNPANSILTIVTKSNENAQLTVFNLDGKIVFEKSINGSVTIPVSEFNGAGNYILRLVNSAGVAYNKVVIE